METVHQRNEQRDKNHLTEEEWEILHKAVHLLDSLYPNWDYNITYKIP